MLIKIRFELLIILHLTRFKWFQEILEQASQLSAVSPFTLKQIIVDDRSKGLDFFWRSDCLRGRHWRLIIYHIVTGKPTSLARLDSCSLPPETTFVDELYAMKLFNSSHHPPSSRLVSTMRSPFLKHSSSLLEPLKGNSAWTMAFSMTSLAAQMD